MLDEFSEFIAQSEESLARILSQGVGLAVAEERVCQVKRLCHFRNLPTEVMSGCECPRAGYPEGWGPLLNVVIPLEEE